jgi:hypothetical protein
VASLLQEQLNVEVAIKRGSFAEFSVWAGEQILTQRTAAFWPGDHEILEAVRGYLNAGLKGNGTIPGSSSR